MSILKKTRKQANFDFVLSKNKRKSHHALKFTPFYNLLMMMASPIVRILKLLYTAVHAILNWWVLLIISSFLSMFKPWFPSLLLGCQ